MPHISVITPTNNLDWFNNAKKNLLKQDLQEWEWIVVVNGATPVESFTSNDPRIKIFVYDQHTNNDGSYNVGALKRFACSKCQTEYIVEYDHDDELAYNCLSEVLNAFITTNACFVYSDAARLNKNGTFERYGSEWGWSYRQDVYNGEPKLIDQVEVANQPPAIPQNVSRIWWAPDHVRAWTRHAYNAVSGHDINLKVCDDLDLMCKLFQYGKFHHIEKPLYQYKIHGNNTWLKNQQLIQTLVPQIHCKYIYGMALKYWKERGKHCIDLGGGINKPAGWTSVDVHSADISANLNEKWPFDDNSVGVIRAHDVIEHLENHIHVMNEAYRCLTHGGLFLIEVPSTDGRGAFQDPSHITFWNTNSFMYYTQAQTQAYIKHLGVNCRFQVVHIENHYPTDWHKQHNIVYARVHLAAIKDGPRLHGEYRI